MRPPFKTVTLACAAGAILATLASCADPTQNLARINAECAYSDVAKAAGGVVPLAGPAIGVGITVACAEAAPIAAGEAWVNGQAKATLGR